MMEYEEATEELESPQRVQVAGRVTRSMFQSPQHRHQALRAALDNTSSVVVNAGLRALEIVTSAVQEADNATGDIDDPIVNQDQILLDSQVMKASSHAIKECARTMNQGCNEYNSTEFAERLLNYLNQLPDETGNSDPWELLTKEVSPYVKACGTHFNMLLPLTAFRDKVDPNEQEKGTQSLTQDKKRMSRQKDALAPAKAPEKILTIANDDNPVDKSVDKISHLIRKWKKRNPEPLNFFKLVIDPRDFGKTVENMLHVAFLLRDGRMTLKVGDDGHLLIEPVHKAQSQAADDENENSENFIKIPNVPALTIEKWKIMINALNITEPMINWE